MNRTLFGRPPISLLEKLSRARRDVEELCASQFQLLFGGFIPVSLIELKADAGTNSRRRVFSPTVTFWAFLGQVLDPGAPCRKALARVQVLCASQGLASPSNATTAYCKARLRLPVRWLVRVLGSITDRLAGSGGGRVLLIDGTTALLPDTASNQARWPQSNRQSPGCGFPLMKLVGIFDMRSGVWLGVARGNKHDGEAALARRLFRHLRRGTRWLPTAVSAPTRCSASSRSLGSTC